MKFVLTKAPSLGEKIMGLYHSKVLSDKNDGKPLLFDSVKEAEDYAAENSNGVHLSELLITVRRANAEDLRRAGVKL